MDRFGWESATRRSLYLTMPESTTVTATYRTVTMTSEAMMPRGTSFCGFRVSSAVVATTSKPMNAKNKSLPTGTAHLRRRDERCVVGRLDEERTDDDDQQHHQHLDGGDDKGYPRGQLGADREQHRQHRYDEQRTPVDLDRSEMYCATG
ncbi:Uncharacterised protein [Mycobacteroides abscessus subsp. massiliense]|nr:Uncharacterised protein [Mycobacteroides abscessus subsp. massiliense]